MVERVGDAVTLFRPGEVWYAGSIARPGSNKGVLRSTQTSRVDGISAATLRTAHAAVESGSSIGKTVLAGF